MAELISDGPQAVMLTARIDAIWEHDGMLDCRDYRTGAPRFDRLADDIGAQIQAIVLAPLARRRSLELRLRHEHLGESHIADPEFREPDDEEIESLRDRMRTIALEIVRSDFTGTAEATTCQRCPYSRACPDSAAEALDEELVIEAVELDEIDAGD